MQKKDIRTLFAPRSVALIGVSRREGSLGRRAVRHVIDHGFAGPVHLVHPSGTEIEGVQSVRSIAELDAAPDLAIVCTDGDVVLGVVEEAVDAGVPAFVVLAASGAVIHAPDELRALLARTGARLLGPNSPGFVGVDPPIAAHISHFLSRQRIAPAPVGLITQSGAVGGILADRLLKSSGGFRWLVCTGNEYDVGLGETLEFLAEQPLRAIGLFVEAIRDLDHFRRGLDLATANGIRVCAVKVGESAAGQRQAMTHTGALTGISALFEQELVKRGGTLCGDLDELAACLAVSTLPEAPARALAVGATSGGLAGLFGDLAASKGMDVPVLEGLNNPWDTDSIVLEDPAGSAAQWRDMLDSPGVGAGVLGFSAMPDDVMLTLGDALGAAGITKPFVMVPAAGMPDAVMEPLRGIAVSVSDSPSALAALDWWTKGAPKAGAAQANSGAHANGTAHENGDAHEHRAAPGKVAIDEAEAKATLEGVGIRVPRGASVKTPAEAVEFARQRGDGPYVLKCLRPAFAHKAAVGAVKLGLSADAGAIEAAWSEMARAVEQAAGEPMTEALIEDQVTPGLELLVSIGHDPDYGAYLTLGAGGSGVEDAPDVTHRLLPADEGQVVSAFGALRIAGGLRNAARARGEDGDVPIDLVTLTLALTSLAADQEGIAVEANPVIVPFDSGPPIAVDCLVVPADA